MTIRITLGSEPRHSDLLIAPDSVQNAGKLVSEYLPRVRRCLIVSDENVAKLYGRKVSENLANAGLAVEMHVVPAGENSKSMARAEAIYEAAIAHQLSRSDAMIALGGGVVGDLTGFCAATYYRGLSFVQIPTTLVAQVDSSVGGKTALNSRTVKNAIGAFYQPQFVLIDPATLVTLPPREVLAGLAEVVKYAFIETSCAQTTGFLAFLEAHADNLSAQYPEIIRRCCEIKARVVMRDELDTRGLRAFLNLGHTFGHAYESLTGYERFLHGEAVALGTIKAFQLSTKLGLVAAEDLQRAERLFQKIGLAPKSDWETVSALDPQAILQLMRQDKKAEQGQLKLVLPSGALGNVVFQAFDAQDVLGVLP